MFNKRIIELQPYVVSKRFKGERNDDWLFLDWNETNYELLPSVKERLKQAIDQGAGVRYPDGDCDAVLDAIKEFTGVNARSILIYNGSDSALKDCIECILSTDDEIAVVEPEYSQINTYVHMAGAKIVGIKLHNPFLIDVDDLVESLRGKRFLYLSNPSNPTGRHISKDDICKLLETGICVLLDEAYVEFAPESCADLVDRYSNIFIFRTFSKAFGIAGLRLGYVLSSAENINMLKKSRNSKEVNTLAQIAATEVLSNLGVYQDRINEIIRTREAFVEAINNLGYPISCLNSTANFVIIKTSLLDELLEFFEKNKVLIRDRRGMYLMDNCARVSIGTPEQMERLTKLVTDFFVSK